MSPRYEPGSASSGAAGRAGLCDGNRQPADAAADQKIVVGTPARGAWAPDTPSLAGSSGPEPKGSRYNDPEDPLYWQDLVLDLHGDQYLLSGMLLNKESYRIHIL